MHVALAWVRFHELGNFPYDSLTTVTFYEKLEVMPNALSFGHFTISLAQMMTYPAFFLMSISALICGTVLMLQRRATAVQPSNLDQLFGVGALAHRGLLPFIGGLCGDHSPHRTTMTQTKRCPIFRFGSWWRLTDHFLVFCSPPVRIGTSVLLTQAS